MATLYRLLISILTLLITAPLLYAHSGGVDKNGGHHNRKTGEYHYHGGSSGAAAMPQVVVPPSPVYEQPQQTQRPSSTESFAPGEIDTGINNYFRKANENVGALDCNVVKYERGVDDATKSAIRHRDGNRCVICGSTVKLEVDHKRALMNGGANNMSNLATLCDDCHTIKTRMDTSLRRKREKVCR